LPKKSVFIDGIWYFVPSWLDKARQFGKMALTTQGTSKQTETRLKKNKNGLDKSKQTDKMCPDEEKTSKLRNAIWQDNEH